MNRDEARELIPVLRAYADGAVMQERDRDGPDREWYDFMSHFQPHGYIYRIKPEPREFWLDPDDNEIWIQSSRPHAGAIKVREVLE